MEDIVNSITNILKENNISVYSLANNSGINQSMLHKILHFERTMKPKHFFAIVENLPISLSEKNALTMRFQKLSMGNTRYEMHNCIYQIFKELSGDFFNSAERKLIPQATGYKRIDKPVIYRGSAISTVVSTMLIEEMARQDPAAYIYLPGASSCMETYIDNTVRLYDTDIKITFMADLLNPASDEKLNYNLHVLKNLLPLSLSLPDNYRFYYTYVDSITDDSYMTPYPYFIITSAAVLLVNHAFDEVMLITDADIAKSHITHFEGKLTKYKKFLESYCGLQNMVESLIDKQSDATEYRFIKYSPGFTLYFTPEIAKSVVMGEIPDSDSLMPTIYLRLSQHKSIKSSIQLFNKNSLMEFAQSGIITEFPSKYSRALTKDERRFMLNSLIESANSKHHIIRAINPLNIELDDCITMLMQSENHILFLILNDKKLPLRYLTVSESTLCKCFYDFLHDFSETNLVYSKEETISFIKEAINYIDKL